MEKEIQRSVRQLVSDAKFQAWRVDHAWSAGDLALLNSSFLLRDGVATRRSARRLTLRHDGTKLELAGVVDGFATTGPFKRVAARSKNLPVVIPLSAAVTAERAELGEIVFTLIGDLADAATGETPLKGVPGFSVVRLDSSASVAGSAAAPVITVNTTFDEAAVWTALSGALPSTAREHVAKALERLEDVATRPVHVPAAGATPRKALLETMADRLDAQADHYRVHLKSWEASGGADEVALHEVLRVSYVFADDALRLLRLVLSVCDLKPLVYWATIYAHWNLHQKLKSLPWQEHRKASLASYVEIVNSARNYAFHDAFALTSSLSVTLPDAAMKDIKLRLFAKHGSKRHGNEVRFKDQELIDLLVQFTRAGRQKTPAAFWQGNLKAMRAMVSLLRQTSRCLVLLR